MSRKDRKREQPAEAAPAEPRPRRLTPVDIQHKEFRLSVRGYNEHEVDEFLDLVTEEVARLNAELKRSQEELEYQRTVSIHTDVGGEPQAILDRARDEAARILADADRMATELRARGAQGDPAAVPPAGGTVGSGPLAGRFLSREKEFLQSLAALIQHHAEAVKDDVRAHRQATEVPGPPEAAAAAAVDDRPEARASETPDPAAHGEPGEHEAVESEPMEGAEPLAPEGEEPDPHEDWRDEAAESSPVDPGHASPGSGRMSFEPASGRQAPSPVIGRHTAALDVADLHVADPPRPDPSVVRVDVPEPDDDAGQDRSIRELFWGED